MSLHSLTFPLIMIGLGAWQFLRAGRIAKVNADCIASGTEESFEQHRAWKAHGYPPVEPRKVRLMGALLICAGIGALFLLVVERLR